MGSFVRVIPHGIVGSPELPPGVERVGVKGFGFHGPLPRLDRHGFFRPFDALLAGDGRRRNRTT
jgi:hypothetical protein